MKINDTVKPRFNEPMENNLDIANLLYSCLDQSIYRGSTI